MKLKNNHQKGFTLMELLVVIAIIATLASVGGVAAKGIINKSKKLKTSYYISELSKGVDAFYADYSRYPTTSAAVFPLAWKNDIADDVLNELCGLPNHVVGTPINTQGKNYIFGGDSKDITRSDGTPSKAGGLTRENNGKIKALQDGWGQGIYITFDQTYSGVITIPSRFNASQISATSTGQVRENFLIWSLGEDLNANTRDDVVSWE